MTNKFRKDIEQLYTLVKIGSIGSNEFLNHLIISQQLKANQQKHLLDTDGDLKEESLEDIMGELHQLIGLDEVKGIVDEVLAYVEIQQKRKLQGLNATPLVLHMIFKGNPGTGKTTVARLLGRIFKTMDLLDKGHLIEVERADLVGEYIGQTALKVRQQVKEAMGGILFIDEAYSLARGGEKDFGKEAIDALVKAMEDYKDSFILILAGYQEEMDDFLKINPGLKSRFPIHIDFQDYTIEELVDIAEMMVTERQYTMPKSTKAKLYVLLASKRKNDGRYSGNARLVRNLIEKAVRKQAVRLKGQCYYTRDDLITLKREDFLDGETL
ncbi:AAA family ATPase [Natronincola ferrireducens]|uniref:Stage V sporulation protein K n=1 Tax=Natronincola ferrireducens TaxID=393762 RepID=A0A1G9CCQ6_9FIRM|nr:AAA family ATPase [Natronincola ferrireducens]SDK49244.1 stage V sporulation protein K [Natronincola ferrireducens]